MTPLEQDLRSLLQDLLARTGAAIEVWTLLCLSDDPQAPDLINQHWSELHQGILTLRRAIYRLPYDPPGIVEQQVEHFMALATELRELFDCFLSLADRTPDQIERCVARFQALWRELRLRVGLCATTIPLPGPLPAIEQDREPYYQSILDGLFDRLMASRGAPGEGA